uniref:G-protein coupled receptors family 1 profile domain-containing protein n=1 Tax=Ascaris lumbricoides TaxID=6252 RepID=A0A0M3HEW7_ASCLU
MTFYLRCFLTLSFVWIVLSIISAFILSPFIISSVWIGLLFYFCTSFIFSLLYHLSFILFVLFVILLDFANISFIHSLVVTSMRNCSLFVVLFTDYLVSCIIP